MNPHLSLRSILHAKSLGLCARMLAEAEDEIGKGATIASKGTWIKS